MTNSEDTLHRDYGDGNWLDEHHHIAAAECRPFRIELDGSSKNAEMPAIDIEDYHVICRTDIAAYLLSSRHEAVGIQVSHLEAVVWDKTQWDKTLIRQPELQAECSIWRSLLESLSSSQPSDNSKIPHKEPLASKSGLVMMLHGPRIFTRNIALGKSETIS